MHAIIHPIEPFDSSIGTNINFTWQGNQIFKVRCLIKDNSTGDVVYDQTISTMKQSYLLPPDSTLNNGGYYIAYLSVIDVDGVESSFSNIGTPFYCYQTPKFHLSIKPGDVIKTSAYQTELTYNQAENELLDYYSITLYTYQKTELSTSGNLYKTDNLTYLISGLENAKQYYIRATGKTLHNMTLDTGYILFTVSYTEAQIFNPLELNNRAELGAIEIKSNITSTVGIPEKEVTYIDHEFADLRGNSVTYDIGFEVKGDFTKAFLFYKPDRNARIIRFTDGGKSNVNIFYREGTLSDSNGEKAFFELQAETSGIKYILFSNYVTFPDTNQQFLLHLNRIGNAYEINASVVNQAERR
ncbi:MAG: hypothetical protein E7248_01270 [Paenibacillaceae bacterium]|nr:hypothetical protein [Paenibacillaceae bacterium]